MALVPDQKFSTFSDGGDLEVTDIVVGLRSGVNTRFNYTGQLPIGVVVPVSQGGTGANNASDARDNLGLGSMAVQNANAVAITGGTAALDTGSVVASPSVDIDIANKLYVDSMVGGSVASVSGTANRITSTGGVNPVIDISAAYVGQTSITTLGTVGTGTWQGTVVGATYGGTGVNNGSFTITLGGSLVTSGAFNSTFTMTGATSVTFPTSGTLATTSQITPQKTTLVTSTPYAVLTTDDILLVDTSAILAPVSIVLPAAPTRDGQVFTVKDIGFDASTYPITMTVAGGGTINSQSSYVFSDDNAAVSFAWSASEAQYFSVYSFDTYIPVIRISGNTGTAAPTAGVITINGGTTGLTTSASGSTLSLTGTLIPTNGGTGVNNGSSTITLGGSLTTVGAFASTFTMTGVTGVTFPTSGTLATTSQIPSVVPAALTRTDDANVTISLGGTPATALLQAVSLTMGWVGTLSVARGGFGFGTTPTNGQIAIGNGTGYTLATLTAGPGISISNGSGSITVSGTGSGIGWTEVTGTSQAMTADSGWVANNAGLVTLTLPSTAAFGTAISVLGKGAGGWKIAQNASQSIQHGSSSTTAGVTGSIASSNRFDSIDLICTTANLVWTVLGAPQSSGLTIA